MSELSVLQSTLDPFRQQLLQHRLYSQLSQADHLRSFLESHVFAVWDFMSLLKRLQQEFCGSATPWTPPRSPTAVRLINEIVLGEESDQSPSGGYASHFQLYREAMQQFGASTQAVDDFITDLQSGTPLEQALASPQIPGGARRFVQSTFAIINSGDIIRIAAAFALGRETLIPDMFPQILQGLNLEVSGRLSGLIYYLDRHIELDGGEHGTAAEQLLVELCGSCADAWQQARQGAQAALQARLRFWDDIAAELVTPPPTMMPAEPVLATHS
ncbi:MAG TPA: hypothetical protein DDY91_22875 [Planctomycetaceae bacterium]|nr:hypothetical protein [Planctomycetaceae bacterium]